MSTKRKTGKGAGQPLRLSKARLDELVEEALVDAYGESEQVEAEARWPSTSPITLEGTAARSRLTARA
jgi:hypothetical protein